MTGPGRDRHVPLPERNGYSDLASGQWVRTAADARDEVGLKPHSCMAASTTIFPATLRGKTYKQKIETSKKHSQLRFGPVPAGLPASKPSSGHILEKRTVCIYFLITMILRNQRLMNRKKKQETSKCGTKGMIFKTIPTINHISAHAI